jgi:uncharacterized protein
VLNFTSSARVVRHHVASPRWQTGSLRIAVLSDIHGIRPWSSERHLARACDLIMSERPDLIILGGDYLAAKTMPGRRLSAVETLNAMSGLDAPLGVFGVLGNHDWKDCDLARANGFTRSSVEDAFAASRFRLLKNHAVELPGFWLAGFDSQCPKGPWDSAFHDPELTWRDVPPGAPAILIAHEPDYFATGDPRAILQISGHTHGGQGNLLGWRPMTPSQFGQRYAHGHITEGDRHLVVSGGLGFSGAPLRINQPPEVTLITISG